MKLIFRYVVDKYHILPRKRGTRGGEGERVCKRNVTYWRHDKKSIKIARMVMAMFCNIFFGVMFTILWFFSWVLCFPFGLFTFYITSVQVMVQVSRVVRACPVGGGGGGQQTIRRLLGPNERNQFQANSRISQSPRTTPSAGYRSSGHRSSVADCRL